MCVYTARRFIYLARALCRRATSTLAVNQTSGPSNNPHRSLGVRLLHMGFYNHPTLLWTCIAQIQAARLFYPASLELSPNSFIVIPFFCVRSLLFFWCFFLIIRLFFIHNTSWSPTVIVSVIPRPKSANRI